MKFYSEAIRGDLILIKTNIQAVPRCPVIAQSAAPTPSWFIRLTLFFLTLFRPAVSAVRRLANLWPPQLSRDARQRVAALSFLIFIMLTMIAENYLEKTFGVMV